MQLPCQWLQTAICYLLHWVQRQCKDSRCAAVYESYTFSLLIQGLQTVSCHCASCRDAPLFQLRIRSLPCECLRIRSHQEHVLLSHSAPLKEDICLWAIITISSRTVSRVGCFQHGQEHVGSVSNDSGWAVANQVQSN